ncbi:transcriptional regulator family: Fungal Specific TF [Penicillium angulare]|uniref:Transcriptional regulator family: Fungal Specific TF n=1 Tax=Penicillium angulare TaxID=116970 RepID=A0A9W9G8Z5_9EURO|nr:transcriptional regulator family: Fungal Specific TF [Penicillium angulare]
MHVFTICVSRDIGRELAENRARTCMLGLTSLQDSWPVSGWILRLFVYIMDKLKIMSKSASLAKASISRPEHVNNNAPFESWPSTGESVTNTPRQGRHARESHDINPDFNSPAINIEVSETGDFPGNVSFDGFSDLNEQGQANFFDFLGFLESADFAAGFNS